MKHFKLTPAAWSELNKIDQKILAYAFYVEIYNEKVALEKIKLQQKIKAK